MGWFKAETFLEIGELALVGNYPMLKDYPVELCMLLEKALIKVKELKRD